MKVNEMIILKVSMLLLSIATLLIAIDNCQKTQEIKDIKNTKYEFCYAIDDQELCSYQKIGDYLNGLD